MIGTTPTAGFVNFGVKDDEFSAFGGFSTIPQYNSSEQKQNKKIEEFEKNNPNLSYPSMYDNPLVSESSNSMRYTSSRLEPGTTFYNSNELEISEDGRDWTAVGPGRNVSADRLYDPSYTIPDWTYGQIVDQPDISKFLNIQSSQLIDPHLSMFRYKEFNGSGYTYFLSYTRNVQWTDKRNAPPFLNIPSPWYK